MAKEDRSALHRKVTRMRGDLIRDLGRACFELAVTSDWSAEKLDDLARQCHSMEIDFEGRTLLLTLDDRELREFADHLERFPGTLRQQLEERMRD